MRGLGHELVRFDDRNIGKPTEVCFKTPDTLVSGQHRVVMRTRVLVINMVAMHGDLVPGLPEPHCRPHPKDDAGCVRADDVLIACMACTPDRFTSQPIKEPKGRERLENRGPDCVEVDGRRHHGDVGLIGRELGKFDLANVNALARILVRRGKPLEHCLVFAPYIGSADRLRHGHAQKVISRGALEGSSQNLRHRVKR